MCGRCAQVFAERNNVSLEKVQHAVMLTKYMVSLEGEAKPDSSREAQGSGGDMLSMLSTEDEDVGDTMAGVHAWLGLCMRCHVLSLSRGMVACFKRSAAICESGYCS
jgi:hypothetical protein